MRENLYLEIGKHREKNDISQGQIGLKAGITESRLSLIVRGRVEPTKKERRALAQVLGIDEKILFECEQLSKA